MGSSFISPEHLAIALFTLDDPTTNNLLRRMTLLLGPPSSGKSTLMRALTGKLDKNLKVSGSITYCGHPISEFYPERTSAHVGQYDLHNAEMTVRGTLDFSRRRLGIGARYEMLAELARRERDAGIKPDPEIDAFMKATAVQGQETNIVTDVTLKAKLVSKRLLRAEIEEVALLELQKLCT